MKWANETIPSLLRPYLQILHESDNLCTLDYFSDIISPGCSCERQVTINVTCVFFEHKLFYFHLFNIYQHNSVGLESMQIHYCQCYPVALQLLRRGLFPCTPTAPMLAVNLKMLEFAHKLILRVTPNNTAWCDTVESILGGRKYKLTTQVSYRNDHILFAFDLVIEHLNRILYDDALAMHYYGIITSSTTPIISSRIY